MDNLKSLLFFPILILVLHLFKKCHYRRLRLPPGPKGIPILGNILDVQAKHKEPTHITYAKWSQKHGGIFTFDVLGSRTVVLNSYKAAPTNDDRIDQMGLGYGFHAIFRFMEATPENVPSFLPASNGNGILRHSKEENSIIGREASIITERFLEAQTGGIILEVLYGYHIQDDNDPYINLSDGMLVAVRQAGILGSFLVDYIPILKHIPAWFPGASFKSQAEAWAQDADRALNHPWTLLKQAMDGGAAIPSFSTRNLEIYGISPSASGDDSGMEEVIKNCAGVGFVAGTDTTVSAILSFILGMTLNPQIQARAQEELDDVVGSSRLPDFSDRDNLPYINAIYAETLRWNPVLPLGLPHATVNDDIYDGYLIPGGSTVVPNSWAVLHDESLYGTDVMNFDPDRFMRAADKDLPPNPELIAFGFGRRICPGRYLAINSLWLAITYLLANCTIAKEVDQDGQEIDPVVEFTPGLVSHPLPFKCRFIPRPEAALLQGHILPRA